MRNDDERRRRSLSNLAGHACAIINPINQPTTPKAVFSWEFRAFCRREGECDDKMAEDDDDDGGGRQTTSIEDRVRASKQTNKHKWPLFSFRLSFKQIQTQSHLIHTTKLSVCLPQIFSKFKTKFEVSSTIFPCTWFWWVNLSSLKVMAKKLEETGSERNESFGNLFRQ